MGGADTSGDVHFLAGDIVPKLLAGRIERFISCQPGNIRHTGIQINRTHRMSYSLILFPDRQVGLVVLIAQLILMAFFHGFRMLRIKIVRSGSTLIHKETAQIQIFVIARRFIETHQCHLCDLMAGISLFLIRFGAETGSDIIRISLRSLQKLILSCRLVISNGALGEVPKAVKLMVILKIGEYL